MKKKSTYLSLAFLLLFACLFFAPVTKVQAANPSTVTLKPGTTYKSYDITGDQKADTIKVTTTWDSNHYWITRTKVSVNGKTLLNYPGTVYKVTATLYTLANGKPFLYLYASGDNGDGPVCGVFQYSSGKMKEVINCQTLFNSFGSHLNGSVSSISGNTMYVKCYVMSWTVGPSLYTLKYTYKNGTLKKATNNISKINLTGLASRGYTYVTARYNMTVYTNANVNATAFTLKQGQKAKFIGAYLKSGKHLMKVQTSDGKTGWIKGITAYPGYQKQPFIEVAYAG